MVQLFRNLGIQKKMISIQYKPAGKWLKNW